MSQRFSIIESVLLLQYDLLLYLVAAVQTASHSISKAGTWVSLKYIDRSNLICIGFAKFSHIYQHVMMITAVG